MNTMAFPEDHLCASAIQGHSCYLRVFWIQAICSFCSQFFPPSPPCHGSLWTKYQFASLWPRAGPWNFPWNMNGHHLPHVQPEALNVPVWLFCPPELLLSSARREWPQPAAAHHPKSSNETSRTDLNCGPGTVTCAQEKGISVAIATVDLGVVCYPEPLQQKLTNTYPVLNHVKYIYC